MKRHWPKAGYRGTLKERLMKRIVIDPVSGCWNWTGPHNRGGYGIIGVGTGLAGLTHRVSYEIHVGPIPDDKELHHTCANRACANPAHLEAVTRFTHQHKEPRSMANRTHCRNGHALVGENLLPSKLKKGTRQCVTCVHTAAKRCYERSKEKKRAYATRNKAKINADARARYAKNPQRVIDYQREWKAKRRADTTVLTIQNKSN